MTGRIAALTASPCDPSGAFGHPSTLPANPFLCLERCHPGVEGRFPLPAPRSYWRLPERPFTSGNESEFAGPRDRMSAVGGTKFAENVADVFLDGIEGHEEVLSDLSVPSADRDELENLELAVGQRPDQVGGWKGPVVAEARWYEGLNHVAVPR